MNESSLNDLFNSAVDAFPMTQFRQHATDPIVVKSLSWTPFLGVKTMFVKGLVQNEGREYTTMMLFKNVNYKPQTNETVRLWASDGMPYKFEKLSLEGTDLVLRCNCPDFKWRFSYYNHLDKSLYGTKPRKYIASEGSNRPPANPFEMPGMCKHLIKLSHALQQANVFKEITPT